MILLDEEAIDVSRMTGIPWCLGVVESRGRPRPWLDLRELDWWDQMRVAFARIGAHYYLKESSWSPPAFSRSESSVSSSGGSPSCSMTSERLAA